MDKKNDRPQSNADDPDMQLIASSSVGELYFNKRYGKYLLRARDGDMKPLPPEEGEQKARGLLRVAANRARVRLPPIEIKIDGVMYSTRDQETLILGESGVGGAHYIGETGRKAFNNALEQLWRTKDGHYFCRSRIDGVTPLDVATAHKYMFKDHSFRRYLTDAHKREIELEDERINPRARWTSKS